MSDWAWFSLLVVCSVSLFGIGFGMATLYYNGNAWRPWWKSLPYGLRVIKVARPDGSTFEVEVNIHEAESVVQMLDKIKRDGGARVVGERMVWVES